MEIILTTIIGCSIGAILCIGISELKRLQDQAEVNKILFKTLMSEYRTLSNKVDSKNITKTIINNIKKNN